MEGGKHKTILENKNGLRFSHGHTQPKMAVSVRSVGASPIFWYTAGGEITIDVRCGNDKDRLDKNG